ncbi:DUF1707 domain-containing protein [Actinoplanes sp. NPDC049668]|uniref:DUF1707 SHOCT-like domain-containing protein n=1 Tax=unclassified Actinoplanes TaxID=2626549 RepID=UPI0033B47BB8
MSEELVPHPPEWRMSDADRNRVVERLQQALGEGRISLDEFEERLSAVLAARTFGDVAPHVADIPGVTIARPAPEFTELRTTAATLKRQGTWVVPRRLLVTARAGSVKLDFTDAVIGHSVVDIELNVSAGTTTLVLPAGASADIDGVEFIAGSAGVRGIPAHASGPGRHFVVHGKQRAGRLIVRYQRRFLRWRW